MKRLLLYRGVCHYGIYLGGGGVSLEFISLTLNKLSVGGATV